jgi:hypothetical protein
MDLLEGPALHLAKQHKRADFSDPQFAHRISSFIHGSSHGVTPSMVAEIGADGYWKVFEAIASGTRTIEELVDAGISREVAQEAVEELLQRELIAESDADELYAAYDVVTVEPYPVPDEHVIDWTKHFDHQLVADLDDDERPETSEDGVSLSGWGPATDGTTTQERTRAVKAMA